MARLELGPPGFFRFRRGLKPRAGLQYIHLFPACTLRENGHASVPQDGKEVLANL
jgi:hypothetical protein